jgi:predicted HicB family RNase H-like nuclease
MSNKLLNYRDYFGSAKFSLDDGILHGKIEFINDLVTYQSDSIPALEKSFHEAVDDYIETCATLGREPQKSMSGSFNVRVGGEIHKKVAVKALQEGVSLNDYVKSALEKSVHSEEKETHHHVHYHNATDSEVHKTVSITRDVAHWEQRGNKDFPPFMPALRVVN